MNMHADILHKWGVPINIAEAISEPRIKEVSRKVLPQNHARAVDAARLLNIPFMSIHTPADNHVNDYLQKSFDRRKPEKVGDIIKILEDIPEYKDASKVSRGPVIFAGSKEKRSGKIFVDMTGGTEGAIESLEKLAQSGVGTIVGMHMSEEHYKNAEKYHINVVIAGHISSDTLGLNLIFDEVEKKIGKLDIIGCSGFKRVKR
jgi:putative NIF3 family GTP cyclohydrolase 1 type 2